MVQSARECSVKSNKWSLQSLAAMNATNGVSNQNLNSTNTKEKRPIPSSHVAETLLEEVMYRLASQHHTCMEMIQQVSDETMKTTSMGGSGRSSITIASSSSKRVVHSLNQSIGLGNMRDWMEQKKVMEKEHKDSISWLKGLEVLHANTFVVRSVVFNFY